MSNDGAVLRSLGMAITVGWEAGTKSSSWEGSETRAFEVGWKFVRTRRLQ